MFALLPVDMLNGIVLKSGINLPISIGQLYKLIVLSFLFLRFLFKPKLLLFSMGLTLLLYLPSIYESVKLMTAEYLVDDLIKISKYLTPLYCFLFFVNYLKYTSDIGIKRTLLLVQFSYIVVAANVLLKYIGLGSPMYEYGSIGSKGFFYAGNEISALLVILSSIIAFNLWYRENRLAYFLFWAFTLFVGLTVSSKTGVIGIMLVFFLIPLKKPSIRLNFKRMLFFLISILVLIPGAIYIIWKFIQDTALFIRLQYFSEKFDFWTFVLSNRNVFFKDAYNTYIEKYSFVEKVFGVGQSQYENLNNGMIVEIDFADILFAFGVLGLIYFIILMLFLIVQALRFSLVKAYPYSNFVLLMVLALLGISTTAGHVYSSGMAAVFIGLLFALMYFKKEKDVRIDNTN